MKIKIIIQETNQRIPLTRKNPIENEDINDPFTEERSMFGSGFDQFKHEAERLNLDEMQQWLESDRRFARIGAGSFRTAFDVLDSKVPVVLKLAQEEDSGRGMNRDEISFYKTNMKVFPKIYDAAKSGAWILIEKVQPFTKENRNKLFPELANFNQEIKSNNLLLHLISTGDFAIFSKASIESSFGEDLNLALLAANELIKRNKMENLKAGQLPRSLLTFMRRPVVMDFLRSYQEGGSSLIDLRDANLGVNEQGELKMIDTGLGV